jgi:hypothetical protein
MNFTKRDSWYRTDWIFPTLSLPGQPLGICAIDLEFTFQESKDGEGILTCFFGMPSLDPFGDADKSKLPSQKIHVTLRKPAGTTLGLPTESFEVYFITAVDTKYIEATLVLNFENPETSRMIVYTVGDNSRTVSRKERVLPLLSERLQRLAEQTAKTDLANVRLYSGQIDNKNAILIEGKNGICTYQHDRNSCSLDWLGWEYEGEFRRFECSGFHGPRTSSLSVCQTKCPAKFSSDLRSGTRV